MASSTPPFAHPASRHILIICPAGACVALCILFSRVIGRISLGGGNLPMSPRVTESTGAIINRRCKDNFNSPDS